MRSRFVGAFRPHLPGSELAKLRGEPLPDALPEATSATSRAAAGGVRDAVRAGDCRSAHDVAEGGFAVAVAECCLAGGLGATDRRRGRRTSCNLFGEGAGGFVVSGRPRRFERAGGRGSP